MSINDTTSPIMNTNTNIDLKYQDINIGLGINGTSNNNYSVGTTAGSNTALLAPNQFMFKDSDRYSGNPYSKNYTKDQYFLGNWGESTNVSKSFFSFQNFKNIDSRLRLEVYRQTNKRIKSFAQDKLGEHMVQVYKVYANPEATDIIKEVTKLNGILINFLLPSLVASVYEYYDNLIDLQNPNGTNFMTPMNTSIRGTKNLRSNADILFGNNWHDTVQQQKQ